jgi:hypothetical protein
MNGIEFLGIIKADAVLKKIPVVVLTTSSEERDVVESFRLSVAGYIIKPVDYRNFVEAVRTIDLYWTLSEIPAENAEAPMRSAKPCCWWKIALRIADDSARWRFGCRRHTIHAPTVEHAGYAGGRTEAARFSI